MPLSAAMKFSFRNGEKNESFYLHAHYFYFNNCRSLFYSDYMTESIDELSLLLSDTETHLEKGDFSSARASAETFSDTLKEKSYTLYFFTDRCPIDNTLTESERLKSFIKAEDDAESAAVLSGIRVMLSKTREKSSLKIYNIL